MNCAIIKVRLEPQGQDKDKDLQLVLKESLRTRARINVTGIECDVCWFAVVHDQWAFHVVQSERHSCHIIISVIAAVSHLD